MKKIIKGKLYDTETAKLIARADRENVIDAYGNSCKQALYQKKTGEFFVHLSSGTSTTLHNIFGADYCQGNGIYPLTYAQAQAFAEAMLPADQYLTIFGEPAEDAEQTHLHVRISPQAGAKLKQAAAQSGITIGEQIERWIMAAE